MNLPSTTKPAAMRLDSDGLPNRCVCGKQAAKVAIRLWERMTDRPSHSYHVHH